MHEHYNFLFYQCKQNKEPVEVECEFCWVVVEHASTLICSEYIRERRTSLSCVELATSYRRQQNNKPLKSPYTRSSHYLWPLSTQEGRKQKAFPLLMTEFMFTVEDICMYSKEEELAWMPQKKNVIMRYLNDYRKWSKLKYLMHFYSLWR